MNVILKADVNGLGKAFDVVKVRDGYGRNWLLPQGLAIVASTANMRSLDAEKKRQAGKLAKLKAGAEEIAKKLGGTSITVSVRVHEGDKLYGAVTNIELATKLTETTGVSIDKDQIVLDEPIKSLGVFNFSVRLHPEVDARIKVWVVKQAG
jgi:large subunit ribosomal protein L9